MRIVSARIKSYRTIKDDLSVELLDGSTLVGPNNAGKTNVLKALRMFFTGYDNRFGYSVAEDLSMGQSHAQTSISITFSGDPDNEDAALYENIRRIHDLLETPQDPRADFTAYLTFNKSSTPVYRLYPNTKRDLRGTPSAQYSKFEKNVFEYILSKFAVHYIPSDKSIAQLYQDLALPYLLQRAFTTVQPHLAAVQQVMDDTAATLSASLDRAGLGHLTCSFAFPDSAERLFRSVDFNVRDPNQTSIFSKGMGIQSAALLGAFSWITDEENASGKSVLWLLEEPESYLHPELAGQCEMLIKELRTKSQVVSTTHSLGFVPQDPKHVVGISLDGGWTKATNFKTYQEATQRIRSSLGVKFSDFYNLAEYNLLLEGETDREYVQSVLENLVRLGFDKSRLPILTGDRVAMLDQGGVKPLEGFLRATYEFIRRERACAVVLDGDAAGDKVRRDLQQFFGKKQIAFQPNEQYVSVKDRYAIEGLFPEEWILETHNEHPNWFSNWSVDAGGSLQPFSLEDSSKRQFFNRMVRKMQSAEDLAWSNEWQTVLSAIEKVLTSEQSALSKR